MSLPRWTLGSNGSLLRDIARGKLCCSSTKTGSKSRLLQIDLGLRSWTLRDIQSGKLYHCNYYLRQTAEPQQIIRIFVPHFFLKTRSKKNHLSDNLLLTKVICKIWKQTNPIVYYKLLFNRTTRMLMWTFPSLCSRCEVVVFMTKQWFRSDLRIIFYLHRVMYATLRRPIVKYWSIYVCLTIWAVVQSRVM